MNDHCNFLKNVQKCTITLKYYISDLYLNHLLTIVVSIFLHRPFFWGTYQSHGTTVAHFLKHRRQNIFTL